MSEQDKPAEVEQPGPEGAPSAAWAAVRRGAAAAGRALMRAGRGAGLGAKQLALCLDPGVADHLGEAALVGLTLLVPRVGKGVWRQGSRGRVTLYVHGLGGSPKNFLPMRAWLTAADHGPSEAIAFEDTSSIEVMARQLQWKILQLAEAFGDGQGPSVDLVAHSMGGIVSRLALTDASVAAHVAHLVTLGTPHSGTGLARFMQSPKVRELRPGSSVLARLEAQLPWPGQAGLPRLTCFWSRDDMLMLPPETACVAGATLIECPGYTHLSFLLKPPTFMAVRDALAGVAPRALLGPGAPPLGAAL